MNATNNGKGSKPRPRAVPYKEYSDNMDRIFPPKPKEPEPSEQPKEKGQE